MMPKNQILKIKSIVKKWSGKEDDFQKKYPKGMYSPNGFQGNAKKQYDGYELPSVCLILVCNFKHYG